MNSMDSIASISAAVRTGQCSASQVLEDCIARIQARDPHYNCFTGLTLERARSEAAAVDRAREEGLPLPPLAGVPYAVKNLFDVRDEVTLAGARINAGNAPAREDALLVQRLRQAGAVLVGMLNMDENAYGFSTENTAYGPTRNPHDTNRIAGGSSGGSAAAIAGGLLPLTLGSDTNGSIRVPSSLCGVFGLKPTYARLPRSGSYPFVQSLDHLGPFASTVADLALAYDVLQGPAPQDHACAQKPVQAVLPQLGLPRKLRVGMLGGWFYRHAGDEARSALRLCAESLEAQRCVDWHLAEAARAAAFVITGAEGGSLHRARLASFYEEFEPLSRDRLVAGSLIPADWVVQAQRVRRAALEQALSLFEEFDILLAPATPVVAPRIGSAEFELYGKAFPMRASMGLLTQPISCIGLPVCTLPVWPDDSRLPIGVQVIAAPWREDLCLAAARLLEEQGVAQFRAAPAPVAHSQ